jgi:hypothetical protein
LGACPLTKIRISTRGIDYCKEVKVVRIRLDMYRDCGEYI